MRHPHDNGEPQHSLGPCCACGVEGPQVNAILMLPLKAMIEGHGWGCLLCGLASDGAVAVLCDACMKAERDPQFACCGYPGTEGRVPIAELTRPHEHDMTKHPQERGRRKSRRKWKR